MKKLYVSLDCKLCGGKIMIKGAKGGFPRTAHDMSFLCWFIAYNFVFQIPHLTLHFRYK
jgi:hypothetical protein